MTGKEYLSQAYRLDQRINSKLEQVEVLRSLTRKVTSFQDGEHVSRTRNVSSLEDTVIHLMEAEDDLNRQIDALVDLKREIAQRINKLENTDYQLLLEKRYLCFQSWEQIAVDMRYSSRWVHIVHSRALICFDKILLDRDVDEKFDRVHKSAHEFT